jgi:hypothetical protein
MSFVIDTSDSVRDEENVKVKFETLRAMEQAETIDIDSHMSDRVSLLMFISEIYLHFYALCSVKYKPRIIC